MMLLGFHRFYLHGQGPGGRDLTAPVMAIPFSSEFRNYSATRGIRLIVTSPSVGASGPATPASTLRKAASRDSSICPQSVLAGMVYAIGQRLRELGIRMALGATPPNVFALVRLKVIGLVLGLIAAFVGVRLIASLLFGVAAHDSLVFFTVATTLAAAVACWLPARDGPQ